MAGFNLYMSGSDDPTWRRLLITEDVKHISIGFSNLVKRLPKTKPYDVPQRYPDDTSILLDSGVHGGGDDKHDWQDVADKYIEFVQHNQDRLAIISEFDVYSLGPEWIDGMRRDFYDQLPTDKFMAVWHTEYGLKELDRLAERYERLAVVGSEVGKQATLTGRLNSIVMKYGVQLHAISVGDPDVLMSVPYTSASTSSWYAPLRFGETIVWNGIHLKRYPADMKDQARKRNAKVFERAGYDAEKIIADDPNEVARFTIWSWIQLANYIAGRRGDQRPEPYEPVDVAATSPDSPDEEMLDLTQREPARWGTAERNTLPVPVEVRTSLPIFVQVPVRVPSEQGGGGEEVVVSRLSPVSVRGCDSCYLAARCPLFKEGSACSYEIPVEIRNRDQVTSALLGMVEMQFQRIAGARFGEELEGGILNPDLSKEIDRFFNMVKKMKEINESNESLTITGKGGAAAGILSRLFGERLIPQIPEPAFEPMDTRQTDQFLQDVEDAQIVEDE